MIFILVLALLIFGPKRLPEVGRTLGKGMAQFRKATSDLKRTIETEIALDAEPPRQPLRPASPARPTPAVAQPQLPASSTPAPPAASAPSAQEPAPETAPGPVEAAEAAATATPAVGNDSGKSQTS